MSQPSATQDFAPTVTGIAKTYAGAACRSSRPDGTASTRPGPRRWSVVRRSASRDLASAVPRPCGFATGRRPPTWCRTSRGAWWVGSVSYVGWFLAGLLRPVVGGVLTPLSARRCARSRLPGASSPSLLRCSARSRAPSPGACALSRAAGGSSPRLPPLVRGVGSAFSSPSRFPPASYLRARVRSCPPVHGRVRPLRAGPAAGRPLGRGTSLRHLLYGRPAPARHLRGLRPATAAGLPARTGRRHLRRLRRTDRHPCVRAMRRRGQAVREGPMRPLQLAAANRRPDPGPGRAGPAGPGLARWIASPEPSRPRGPRTRPSTGCGPGPPPRSSPTWRPAAQPSPTRRWMITRTSEPRTTCGTCWSPAVSFPPATRHWPGWNDGAGTSCPALITPPTGGSCRRT